MTHIIPALRESLLVGLTILALLVLLLVSFSNDTRTLVLYSWQRMVKASEPDTLRVRILEIVDSAGVARLRLGAPLPGPQIGGKISPRRSAANGIQINDAHGDEMGGFSMLDDGTLSLCFDTRNAEASCMYVMPSGERGFVVTDNAGKDRAKMIFSADETVLLSLNDAKEKTRAEIRFSKDSGPQARLVDEAGKNLWAAPRSK